MINGGEITIGKTVNRGDYNSERVDVKFTFGIPEGADAGAIADQAIDLAKAKIAAILGGAPVSSGTSKGGAGSGKEPGQTGKPSAPASTKETAAQKMNAADEKKAPAKQPPKSSVPATGQNISTGGERKEPEGDSLDDLLGGEAAKPITDKDLTDAITAKNAKMNNAGGPKIRSLIREFVPEPKRVVDIPQADRAAFLKKLEDLK